jgi:hypothetical protein
MIIYLRVPSINIWKIKNITKAELLIYHPDNLQILINGLDDQSFANPIF